MRQVFAPLLTFVLFAGAAVAQPKPGKTLDIYFIDTEGGLSALYLSPTGESLLIDTGKWLSGRRVLISPAAVEGAWSMSEVPVALTRDQIWNSPAITHDRPPSRADEAELLQHYGQPLYWRDAAGRDAEIAETDRDAEHLRSTREVTGYHIQASDGEVGHVDDFLIGEKSWRIRYLRVDTSNWLGGRSVIVAADTLEWIDRTTGRLNVRVSREAVKQSPPLSAIESELNSREVGPSWLIL